MEEQVTSEPGALSAARRSAAKSATQGASSLRTHIAALADGQVRARVFQGLYKPERYAILSAAQYRHFTRETVVVHQADPADRLFLLLRGSARFFVITPEGCKVYLHWLAPGEVFGGASLIHQPTSYLVSTEVSKGTHVLVWQRNIIRSLASVYPRLLENALLVATDYLTWYLASHLSLVCDSARERLAHVLVTLAEGIGHKSAAGIHLDITNEQLANTANITLFTASRLLGEFQRSGAVTKSRGRLLIRRPEDLFREAVRPASAASNLFRDHYHN